MSEGGEKTELPTPKKERDARQKGQVAKSTEVVTTLSLLAVVSVTISNFDSFIAEMISLTDRIAQLATQDFAHASMAGIEIAKQSIITVLLPLLGVAILIGIAANYIQIGSLFSLESVSPSLEKISPAAGFKRIFSMKQLVEMLKSIIKIVFLSVLLYLVLRDSLGAFLMIPYCGLGCMAALVDSVLMQILIYAALAFIIVAIADFAYQKHTHIKSLMMSKDEIKREYKESEGDPHIKGKRKQLAHELAMGDGGAAARKGTAAVVNPTHYTVIISYRPESYPLPIITAKGVDRNAHYLRAEAESAGVPVFLNVKLARGLYESTPIDQPIPDEMFDAVAEVLAWVNRHKDRLYNGVLDHGHIDMEAGEHRTKAGGEERIEQPGFITRAKARR